MENAPFTRTCVPALIVSVTLPGTTTLEVTIIVPDQTALPANVPPMKFVSARAASVSATTNATLSHEDKVEAG